MFDVMRDEVWKEDGLRVLGFGDAKGVWVDEAGLVEEMGLVEELSLVEEIALAEEMGVVEEMGLGEGVLVSERCAGEEVRAVELVEGLKDGEPKALLFEAHVYTVWVVVAVTVVVVHIQ